MNSDLPNRMQQNISCLTWPSLTGNTSAELTSYLSVILHLLLYLSNTAVELGPNSV
jgi:hypothetical protein